MENICEKIVKNLIEKNKTISFMESCTGGFLSSQITNIEHSSEVLKVGIVTYSNEYKIKFSVPKKVIDTYSVYSIETAKEMAKSISNFAHSDIGVGVTGELAKDSSNKVFYAIYIKENNTFITNNIVALGQTRNEKKEYIAKEIFKNVFNELKK